MKIIVYFSNRLRILLNTSLPDTDAIFPVRERIELLNSHSTFHTTIETGGNAARIRLLH